MTDEPPAPVRAEDAIIDARRAKAARVRERGENPFANDVAPRLGGRTVDIAEARAHGRRRAATRRAGTTRRRVRAIAGEAPLHVRGRVIALRSTGGLSFLRLRDRTGEIQLLVSEAALGRRRTRGSPSSTSATSSRPRATLTASKRGELSIAPRARAAAHQGATARCPRSGTA